MGVLIKSLICCLPSRKKRVLLHSKSLREIEVFINSFGIPFKITCSGETARQFYNPLQERNASLTSAALDGKMPANVALNFLFRH